MRQNHELYNHLFESGCSFYYGSIFSRFSNEKMSPWLTILSTSNNLSFAFYLVGLDRLWNEVVKDCSTPTKLDGEQFEAFLVAFLNLPSFLKTACYLHYVQGLSFAATAQEMQVSEQLAKQWIDVSIALFRLLYSSKPKNPE